MCAPEYVTAVIFFDTAGYPQLPCVWGIPSFIAQHWCDRPCER